MTLNTPSNNQLKEKVSQVSTFLGLEIDGVVISTPDNKQISSHINAFLHSGLKDIFNFIALFNDYWKANNNIERESLGAVSPQLTDYESFDSQDN